MCVTKYKASVALGEMEKFLKSLYIFDKGVITPYFMKTPYIAYPSPFFEFCPPTPPSPHPPHTHTHAFPVSSNPHPNALFSCFLGWLGDHATLDVLFYLRIIWIYTSWALIPEGPWGVFYVTRSKVYWGLTHVFFYWYSDLISHTQRHTKPSGASQLTHHPDMYIYIYTTCYVIYIFTPPVMCSQRLPLLH